MQTARQALPRNTTQDPGASSSSDPQPPPAPQSELTQAAENDSSKGKHKQTPSSHDQQAASQGGKHKQSSKSTNNDQPAQAQKRANVRGLSNTHIASTAIHTVARRAARLVAFAYEAITGITTASTKMAEAERLARYFQLRHSSKG